MSHPPMPPFPERIAALPRNDRGFPVPFFVETVNGKPDFRMVRREAIAECVQQHRCWICGGKLGSWQSFVVGPMCCVSRTSAEPPSHRQCAEFAVQACPFMLQPDMVRREDDLTRKIEAEVPQPGEMIKRNPGVTAIWTTKMWALFPDGKGQTLFRMGNVSHLSWWREGRAATFAEVAESIRTGASSLEKLCPDKLAMLHLSELIENTIKLARSTTHE